jgi:hypothetical protein
MPLRGTPVSHSSGGSREIYGLAQHQAIYASIAQRVYVPSLTPDFGYVHWREGYELEPILAAYQLAEAATDGFENVAAAQIACTIREHPTTLRVFRLMLGLTPGEFAEATGMVGTGSVSKARIGSPVALDLVPVHRSLLPSRVRRASSSIVACWRSSSSSCWNVPVSSPARYLSYASSASSFEVRAWRRM